MLPVKEEKDVFAVGFDRAWADASAAAAAIRLPARCKDCASRDQCRACAAMVYTETGNFNTVPEYRCRMTCAYPDACRRVEAEILQARTKEGV